MSALYRRRRREQFDREELAHLLPRPADTGLSSDRHRVLKEHLMSQLQQQPVPSHTRRRVLAIAPAAAAAAAAAAVGLSLGGKEWSNPPREARGPGMPTGEAPTARVVLENAAAAASARPAVHVRDDQFIYIDSMVSWGNDPVHRAQSWMSVDGSKRGWAIQPCCGDLGTPPQGEATEPSQGTLRSPTYAFLTRLPTNPDRLLAMVYDEVYKIYGHAPPTASISQDMRVFEYLGNLIRGMLVPPKLSIAIYRAAAKIPGVTVVADVTDAAGRHGVAVGRTDEVVYNNNGFREEWIFDKKSYEYLGERNRTRNDPVTATTAILTRAVVDHVRELPDK